MPRTFAIGDIHGCNTALDTLLDAIDPSPEDTVVVLGDVVDRGPGTKQCIDRLIRLRDECRTVFVMGNHEEMMLQALHGLDLKFWLTFGGREAVESYGGSIENVPESHREFLESMQDAWVTPGEYFVHAHFDDAHPIDRQPTNALRWQHLDGWEPEWPVTQRIVCGHTSQKDGVPKLMPGWVCIDTCAHGGEWLTALEVNDDLVWQANDFGRSQGPLPLDEVAVPFPRKPRR